MLRFVLVIGVLAHGVVASASSSSASRTNAHRSSSLSSFSAGTRIVVSNNECRVLKNHGRATTTFSRRRSVLFSIRGGSDGEEESDDDEEESDDEDDDAIFAGLEVEDIPEEDFEEDNVIDRQIQKFKKSPPLTKAYLSAAFAASAIGTVLNKGDFPPILSLDLKMILTRMQVWRVFTSFLNLGSLGIFWFITAQFVWEYMGSLERLLHKTPYDFWIMIGFGMMSMVIGYPALKLSPRFLGHNLSTYLVYIWSRYHEGMEVNLFSMIMLKAELLPWFMVGQTALLEGEMPTLDLLGIAFGFVYHYLNTVGALKAPKWLVTWYNTSPSAKSIKDQYDVISSDFGNL